MGAAIDPADDGAFTWVEVTRDDALIAKTSDAVLDHMDRLAYPKNSRFAIKLAFEEGLQNAFKHGHHDLPESTPVRVGYRVDRDQVAIVIEDRGPGFRPEDVPDPTDPSNLEKPSGRGVMLMRAYMSEVRYNDPGNRVCMIYRRPENDDRE